MSGRGGQLDALEALVTRITHALDGLTLPETAVLAYIGDVPQLGLFRRQYGCTPEEAEAHGTPVHEVEFEDVNDADLSAWREPKTPRPLPRAADVATRQPADTSPPPRHDADPLVDALLRQVRDMTPPGTGQDVLHAANQGV